MGEDAPAPGETFRDVGIAARLHVVDRAVHAVLVVGEFDDRAAAALVRTTVLVEKVQRGGQHGLEVLVDVAHALERRAVTARLVHAVRVVTRIGRAAACICAIRRKIWRPARDRIVARRLVVDVMAAGARLDATLPGDWQAVRALLSAAEGVEDVEPVDLAIVAVEAVLAEAEAGRIKPLRLERFTANVDGRGERHEGHLHAVRSTVLFEQHVGQMVGGVAQSADFVVLGHRARVVQRKRHLVLAARAHHFGFKVEGKATNADHRKEGGIQVAVGGDAPAAVHRDCIVALHVEHRIAVRHHGRDEVVHELVSLAVVLGAVPRRTQLRRESMAF